MTQNIYDTVIRELWQTTLNLYKDAYESFGEDLGETENKMDYYNYLKSDPIELGIPGSETDYDYGNDVYDSKGNLVQSSPFVDYAGPIDGSIGSKAFPQGKGKCIDPKGIYWPFYTFGFGASPRKRPNAAHHQRTGIECCKLAVETILGYLNKGCRTIGDVICKYHTGRSTYEEFLRYYNSIPGIQDIADRRFVSSQEMIVRQNRYQQHLVDYVHMSNKTPVTRSKNILFPLITFISRQEQGVNCEEACRIALEEMGIT